MTRKQRVTRAVYGVFVALVAVFVGSSIVQVARVVFSTPDPAHPAASAAALAPKASAACSAALAAEIDSIDDARARAMAEPDGDAAGARYARERTAAAEKALKERPPTEQACANDPNDKEALAALARLDRTTETHVVRTVSELRPVRLAAQSFIRDLPQ